MGSRDHSLASALVGLACVGFTTALGCKGSHEGKPDDGVKAAEGSTPEGAHSDEPEHRELPKRIHVTPEVIAGAKIKTGKVVREAFDVVLELPGELGSDPDKTARVATPATGSIDRVAFAEGTEVKAHDLLAVVRVPDLAERQSTYSSVAARAGAAATKQKRLEMLHQNGLASTQDLESARGEAASLEAESGAAAERLRVLGLNPLARPGSLIELRAPIAGSVVFRDAVVGQPLAPDHVIATIVDLQRLWFLGRIFEKDLARIRLGAAAEVELNAYPSERFNGKIEYVGQQIDPVARTVIARIVLDNRQGLLRLGLFGTARISAGGPDKPEPVLVVPRDALTEISGKSIVFVHHPDDDFELHEVVVGRSSLGKTEVLGGLREGEEIVTEGVFSLKSLVLKSSIEEDE